MGDRTERMCFYNLDNGRDPGQVGKEIKALLDQSAPLHDRPVVLVMCECVGYEIKDRGGFATVRSTANKSRKNIAAYVRNDVFNGHVSWNDCTYTWARTNPGASGQHEPRSYPAFQLGTMQIVGVHQPPKNADTCPECQEEGIDLLVDLMKPPADANDHQRTRPRLAIGDFNRRKGESGPGPDSLANRIDGVNAASKIDTVVRRAQGKVSNVAYPSKVNGVTLKSDHGHALTFDFTCPAEWYEPSS